MLPWSTELFTWATSGCHLQFRGFGSGPLLTVLTRDVSIKTTHTAWPPYSTAWADPTLPDICLPQPFSLVILHRTQGQEMEMDGLSPSASVYLLEQRVEVTRWLSCPPCSIEIRAGWEQGARVPDIMSHKAANLTSLCSGASGIPGSHQHKC